MTEPTAAARWRTALIRLPLPAVFVIAFVVWTGGGLLLRAGDHRLDTVTIVLRVVFGLGVGAVAVLGVDAQRRRVGGTRGQLELYRALHGGDVPADADADGWRRELELERRRVNRAYWLGIPFAAVLAVGGAWAAIAVPRSAAVGWLLVALAVVLLVVALMSAARQRPRIDRLLAQLRDR